jgi:hypothetical protein
MTNAEVMADRDPRFLEYAPERVVAGVVIVGKAELARVVGEVHRARAEAREALYFPDRVGDVDDGHLIRHGQPPRIVSREVGEVVGEGAADGTPVSLDETIRAKRADLRVEHLRVDAVAVHRRQARDGVVVARVAHRLHVEIFERQIAAAAHLIVDARLQGDGVVECRAQRLRDSLPDGVEAHRYVRVGGDQSELRHARPPSHRVSHLRAGEFSTEPRSGREGWKGAPRPLWRSRAPLPTHRISTSSGFLEPWSYERNRLRLDE